MLVVHAPYTKVETLWTCLQTKMEEDLKARQDKLDSNNAKTDANREKKEGRHESL
jgi:hypothetical protein